ncbi:SAM-dependent methyltransferase, partial [Butyricicoccus sp. 1XD8-22]
SQPRQKSNEIKRIKLKPLLLKDVYHIQFEYQYERILKHENVILENFIEHFEKVLDGFRQLHFQFTNETIQIQLSKKNKVFWKSEESPDKVVNLS